MKKVLSLLCMTLLIGFVSSTPRLQATEGKLDAFLGEPALEPVSYTHLRAHET